VVGDFDPAELEEGVLRYLGTVSPEPSVPLPDDPQERLGRPLAISASLPLDQRHLTWHLKDSGGHARGGCMPHRGYSGLLSQASVHWCHGKITDRQRKLMQCSW
jgi:hypothetical protein